MGKVSDAPSRWPVELGAAFNLATLLFALPVYDKIFTSPGVGELLFLVVTVQVLPTVAIFAIVRALGRAKKTWRLSSLLWLVLLVAAVASVLRVVQADIAPGGDVPSWLKMGGILALVVVLVAWLTLGARTLVRGLGSLAPAFLAVSAYFCFQTLVGQAALFPPSFSLVPSSEVEASALSRTDSVYIIIFDELGRDVLLKDGTIDGDKLPHFKALAAESVWFSNATINYGATCQSIPSLLTGRRDIGRRLAVTEECRNFVLMSEETNVLVTLGEHYAVSVFGEYFRDCERSSPYTCRGISYLMATQPHLPLAAHLVPNSARKGPLMDWLGDAAHTYTWSLWHEFLSALTPEQARGRVHFVHILLPHFPYAYDAQGRPHHSPYQQLRGEPEHDARAYVNYAQQVMLVDGLVGEFVAKLKQQGLYDQATIVITGDHGPAGADRVADKPYLEGITRLMPHVPLLIKSPRLQPQVSDVDYQHIDFAPTLLDVLAVEPKTAMDGISAFRAERPVREKRFTRSRVAWIFEPETGRWRRQR